MTQPVQTIDVLLAEHAALEQALADPELHSKPDEARKAGRRFARLAPIVATHRKLVSARDDLETARELAVEAHALLAVGVDPISARQSRRAIPTFGEAADSWMADKAGELRSPKSLERWKRALTVHAAALRDIRVDGVTTEDVLAVLKPIWSVKAETATGTSCRLCSRFCAVTTNSSITFEPGVWAEAAVPAMHATIALGNSNLILRFILFSPPQWPYRLTLSCVYSNLWYDGGGVNNF